MNIYRNPFIVGLWAPAYLVIATGATMMDFLMTAMFILGTMGVLGAYVTDFPMLPGLYQNEMAHKTALASLLGMLFGLILFFIFTAVEDTADSSPMSPQGMFFATWAAMSIPAYPLMVYFVFRVNKRDLDAEQKIRDEKKKQRRSKGGGPPIKRQPGF